MEEEQTGADPARRASAPAAGPMSSSTCGFCGMLDVCASACMAAGPLRSSLVNGWLNPVVDNAAHVGGFIGGAILGWIMTRPLDVEARRSAPIRQSAVAVAIVACSTVGLWGHAGGTIGDLPDGESTLAGIFAGLGAVSAHRHGKSLPTAMRWRPRASMKFRIARKPIPRPIQTFGFQHFVPPGPVRPRSMSLFRTFHKPTSNN